MARNRKKNQPLDDVTREIERTRNRFEPLREDLRHYVEETRFGDFIRHPFCNSPIPDLDRCALIHEQIDRRAAEADACFEAQDWEGYIDAIEYQFQPEWFAKDAHLLPDDRYWTLLSRIYQLQKFTIHDRDLFDTLFRSKRPGRERLMTQDEQAVLARLPKRLRVYRGYSGDELYADGIAWTLDRRQAVWYANWHREDDDPMVASGTVAKAKIWAYLNGGDILLPSEAVTNRRDVEAFDETARVAWQDFVTPKFDVTPMLSP
jgi:hypothetical protein